MLWGWCGLPAAVLSPTEAGGLPPSEATLASMLASRGYVACAVGKWHLGQRRAYLPAARGLNVQCMHPL